MKIKDKMEKRNTVCVTNAGRKERMEAEEQRESDWERDRGGQGNRGEERQTTGGVWCSPMGKLVAKSGPVASELSEFV